MVIPISLPRREVRDIISWIDCWITYCQVVLTSSPFCSIELLKYLDLIMRTHRSFPSMDVWLRYDRGFWRKSACSPVPLDWGSTDLEVFHQSYTSSKVLQPAALSVVSSLRGAPPRGEAQGSPQPQKSAAPGTAVIALAVSHSANASTSAPSVKGLTAPSRASVTPATTPRGRTG